MRKLQIFLCFFGLLVISATANAQLMQVKGVRLWAESNHTRLVFDVSKSPAHKVFLLDNPKRLVVDFKNTQLKGKIKSPPRSQPLLKSVRTGIQKNNGVRIVYELKSAVKIKVGKVQPGKSRGHRLVVDLYGKGKLAVITAKNKKFSPIAKPEKASFVNSKIKKSKPAPSFVETSFKNKHSLSKVSVNQQMATIIQKNIKANQQKTNKATKRLPQRGRDIIVAIDAGHGGKDPGARGKQGTKEKEVVLAIAKKLQALLKKQAGIKPVMVRSGDYFIPLRKRIVIARQAGADLFISIHADAIKKRHVQGASVYTLSNRGASSEAARWLAKHENAADLVGGVSLDDKGGMLASVLLDMSQSATKEASYKVADKVLKNFGRVGKLHSHRVQSAGFMVLKSPDIPSILVETAFISNPGEEKKLRSSHHQQKMAAAIYKGILSYFRDNAPMGTKMAKAREGHFDG